VYDFKENLITGFLMLAEDYYVRQRTSSSITDTLGITLGMCGIRHASFMLGIVPSLLGFMFQPGIPEILRGAQRRDFFTGVLNVFEALQKTDIFRSNSSFIPTLILMTKTLPLWVTDWPQVTPVLRAAPSILQESLAAEQVRDILAGDMET